MFLFCLGFAVSLSTCLKRPYRGTKNWFPDKLLLSEGFKYCRML